MLSCLGKCKTGEQESSHWPECDTAEQTCVQLKCINISLSQLDSSFILSSPARRLEVPSNPGARGSVVPPL